MPDWRSSSTTYCTTGLRPTGSISFGWVLVAGSSRVPNPATGTTARSISMVGLRGGEAEAATQPVKILKRIAEDFQALVDQFVRCREGWPKSQSTLAAAENDQPAIVAGLANLVADFSVREVKRTHQAAATGVGKAANSPERSRKRASKWLPTQAALATRSSSSITSRIRSNRTMSTRLPPQVELMRLETWKTLSSTSSSRRPARMPQTCAFLPNARMSGSTPNCSCNQNDPRETDAGLDFVEDEEGIVFVGQVAQTAGENRAGSGCLLPRPESARR